MKHTQKSVFLKNNESTLTGCSETSIEAQTKLSVLVLMVGHQQKGTTEGAENMIQKKGKLKWSWLNIKSVTFIGENILMWCNILHNVI